MALATTAETGVCSGRSNFLARATIGPLHSDAAINNILAIKITHGVLGITLVFKLHKAKPAAGLDITTNDLSVLAKQFIQIAACRRHAQAPNVQRHE